MENKNAPQDLNAMHVYDLRDYARFIGVRSPTAYRKMDLIIAIRQIEQGIILPYKPKVILGRKPRRKVQERTYTTKRDVKMLRQENLLLVKENRKLTDTLMAIQGIVKGVLKI